MKKPIQTMVVTSPTSVQVLEPKLPISQKIMTATCSSATYFKKLMPADKMAATMMPDNIKLFEDNFVRGYEDNAQLCVYVGEEKVIDLVGGSHRSRDEYNSDSLSVIFSSGKSVESICFAKLGKYYLHTRVVNKR